MIFWTTLFMVRVNASMKTANSAFIFTADHSIYNINTNKQLRSQCISKLANPTANMFDTLVQDQLAFLNTSIFREFSFSKDGIAASASILGQL